MDSAEIKKNGFIPQKQKDRYSLRLKITGGNLEAAKLAGLGEIAQKFGAGRVHFTSRQSVEIPFLKGKDLHLVLEELKEKGLSTGRLGARVRTVTACQGSAVCRSGLMDTFKFAKLIDRKFSEAAVPHKFKIGITGCSNNCLKAEENDLGLKGAVIPEWNSEHCIYCGLCEQICPANAIKTNCKKQSLKYHREKCLNCGLCLRRCPKQCWSGEHGFRVYLGGIFGKKISLGRCFLPVITDREILLKVIATTIDYFNTHGRPSERLAFTLERQGRSGLIDRLAYICSGQ